MSATTLFQSPLLSVIDYRCTANPSDRPFTELHERHSISYDHLGLKVKNLDASVRFYAKALAPLGHVVCSHDVSGAGLGPKDAPALWLSPGSAPSGVHIAFKASARSQVDRFHAEGLAAGGRDNGAPGIRSDYGPSYYAAYLLDVDGNNVEAVCLQS